MKTTQIARLHWAYKTLFARFLVLSDNSNFDSVHWQFGNDPRFFYQSSLIFQFDDPVGEVLVTAIAYRSISYECFGPEDDGIDTIRKSIYILSRDDAPIWGTYRGVNDNETDSFNVTIGRDTFRRDGNLWYEDYYQGLPKGSNEKHGNMFVDWHRMYSTGSPASTSLDGLRRCHTDANLDPNNTDLIIINWRHNDSRETERTFKGVRIK